MRLKCKEEIPNELLRETDDKIVEHIGKRIVYELCKGITDIIANGEEYIFSMTYADIVDSPFTNSLTYQREVKYQPLVRCKDCQYKQYDITHNFCEINHHKCYDDDFCAWGERREE